MKALTICQPYAEMIALGEKVIENRNWPTSYRGPLLIHAGKSRSWMDEQDERDYPGMAFGAIVAVADMIDCRRYESLPLELQRHEHANGRDPNQAAFAALQHVIEATEGTGKNPLAVALGRLGGLKGGKARAQRMTDAERSASASRAAQARWNKPKE